MTVTLINLWRRKIRLMQRVITTPMSHLAVIAGFGRFG
jgi:hypothetical protein